MILDPKDVIPLTIGGVVVSNEAKVISTVLGSCISVCLYAPRSRAGGMNHFALAQQPGEAVGDNPFHYGEEAIRELVDKLQSLTGEPCSQFLAKIAGGASGLSGGTNRVGPDNIDLARKSLKLLGIPLLGEDVGGKLGRKVLFYPQTGRLLVSTLLEAAAA